MTDRFSGRRPVARDEDVVGVVGLGRGGEAGKGKQSKPQVEHLGSPGQLELCVRRAPAGCSNERT